MYPKLSDAKPRKMLRRAVATIRDSRVRDMVMTAPHKALFWQTDRYRRFSVAAPVPSTDPPIAGPFLHMMLECLRLNSSVILITDNRETRVRVVALLLAELEERQEAPIS